MTQEQAVQAIIDRAVERSNIPEVKLLLQTPSARDAVTATVAEYPEIAADAIESAAITVTLHYTECLATVILQKAKDAKLF